MLTVLNLQARDKGKQRLPGVPRLDQQSIGTSREQAPRYLRIPGPSDLRHCSEESRLLRIPKGLPQGSLMFRVDWHASASGSSDEPLARGVDCRMWAAFPRTGKKGQFCSRSTFGVQGKRFSRSNILAMAKKTGKKLNVEKNAAWNPVWYLLRFDLRLR